MTIEPAMSAKDPGARTAGARAVRLGGLAITIAVCSALVPAALVAQTAPVDRTVPRTATLPGVEGAPFEYARPEDVGLDPAQIAEMGDLAAGWVAEEKLVGAEVLVIKDRKIVLHEAVGWSDREAGVPLERNSVYRLRSMTKPFTGTAALMLVEEGLLDLDAPVGRYLPSWANERSGGITVRQLLTHTSGFEQGGSPEPASTYPSLRAVVDASGGEGPQHPPGEGFIYSDVDSYALGALVAELTGMPAERFIETRILEPAGLRDTHTGWDPDAEWAPRMNPTYWKNDAGEWERYWIPAEETEVYPYFRASGGILATALDYAKWLAFVMDGTRLEDGSRLLSEGMLEEALRVHGSDEDGGYGFHWEVGEEPAFWFGHGGSDGTLAVAYPGEDLMLLYFTQSRGAGLGREWGAGGSPSRRRAPGERPSEGVHSSAASSHRVGVQRQDDKSYHAGAICVRATAVWD